MGLRELMSGLTEGSTVRRVFGEPIERDGVLIIPVARLSGAFGGGEGSPAPAPGADSLAPMSWGGGGAWSASPAGTYVLKNGEVTWVPAVDANRVVLLGCLTGIVSMLAIRSIVRTLAKRR